MSFPNDQLTRAALLAATLLVTFAFFTMVQSFLIALLLAAITASLAEPLRDKVLTWVGARRFLASSITLALLTIAVILPILSVIALAAAQAQILFADVSLSGIDDLSDLRAVPDWMPFQDTLSAHWTTITEKAEELASDLAGAFTGFVGQLAAGTAQFLLNLFIFGYGVFAFLAMRQPILIQLLAYSGLAPETQAALYERIVTVSGATLKGTLVIGFVQGGLGGLGLWVADVEGVAFWSVIMVVLSVIPAVGPLLALIPIAIALMIDGQMTAGIGLAVWGFAVVGTIDNILRPMLVGREAALHDLMILISTLGGLVVFGAVGLVLGPVLAGLFVSLWDTLKTSLAASAQSSDALDAKGGRGRAAGV
ncbi:MAG: AI-2E family transporter [Pseudomonadota bacterium]